MAVKVGINGFGRIGRNIMRAAMGDDVIDIRRRQRPDQRGDARPPAQVRLDPGQPEGGHLLGRRPDHRRRRRVPGALGEGPGAAAVEGARRGRRVRVDGPLHQPRRCGQAPGGGREEGHHHGAGQEPGPDGRPRRQRRQVRPGQAPHHLERVLHDQLPGAGRQGAARVVRHPQGLDDDRPLVHERSAAARPPAQGPAPRARGGAVDHPDDDRRRVRRRRGAAGAQGPARRHRHARADAERVGRRPGGDPGQEDDDGRGQRGVQGGGERPAQGHPRVHGRAARLDRLPRQPALVHPRCARTRASWTATS